MGKKYQIIYADPPWSIGNPVPPKRLGKEVKDHYGVMTPEVIKSLPVQNIAEDNCMLFTTWFRSYKFLGI
jgi:N6-adenosine-specific RNA methylase IME4